MKIPFFKSFTLDRNKPVDQSVEIGVAGAKISSGFVHDEFLIKLQGQRGQRTYREMRDNDATVGGILFAIEMLLRSVKWRVEFADIEDTTTDEGTETVAPGRTITTPEQAIDFVESVLFDDMEHTFDDFITNVLSMLTFGWQYTEIVWKRRDGSKPYASDVPPSVFDDGLIGIHKLADRSQETLERWDVDDKGKIYGMYQQPPNGGTAVLYIPMEKSLLFRPKMFKDSPEGRSTLRNAYRSWYFLKTIQEIEAIGIERELNGLPVVKIPGEILTGANNPNDPEQAAKVATLARYIQIARDIKLNEQGGAVIPSNTYKDKDGSPSTVPQYEISLLSTNGSRAIDTTKVINRYQYDIARTVLADFIMLGSGDKGSFALSQDKSSIFMKALSGWLDSIAATCNRQLLPKLWRANGLDPAIMPNLVPGNIAPEDLGTLGEFVSKLASSGFMIADKDTEDHLREVANLPKSPIQEDGEPVITFEEGDEDEEEVIIDPDTEE